MFQNFIRKKFAVVSLTVLLLGVVCSTLFLTSVTSVSAASTLKDAAATKGLTFGTGIDPSRFNSSAYTNILNSEFNSVTTGDEMSRWNIIEPVRGYFNFSGADTVVSYALSRNMKIRGHSLVWHNQLPGWINNLNGSELLYTMKYHITNIVGRYRGVIDQWDVVADAFMDTGVLRPSIFYQRIGSSYIEEAFKQARLVYPNAKLCYSDYGIEAMNAKSNAVYNMVRDFKIRGIPIDCVGFQVRLTGGQVPPSFQTVLQRFADLNIDVQLTHLNIRIPTPATTANLQQQALDYGKVVRTCLAVSRCNNISVLGVTDNVGENALLFNYNYNKKPSYYATLEALGE